MSQLCYVELSQVSSSAYFKFFLVYVALALKITYSYIQCVDSSWHASYYDIDACNKDWYLAHR